MYEEDDENEQLILDSEYDDDELNEDDEQE